MSGYVRVAVNVPSLAGVHIGAPDPGFDYRLPSQLEGQIGAGHLVLVPFGNRIVQGVVLHVLEQPAVEKTKDVLELVDSNPVMTGAQLALARWMAEASLTSASALLGLFLPPGLERQVDTIFSLREPVPGDVPPQRHGRPFAEATSGTVARRLLGVLERRGPLRARQIDRALPHLDWRRTAQSLVRRGVIESQSVLPPASVRPKFIRTAQLAVSPATAQAHFPNLGTTPATQLRRERAMQFLIQKLTAVNLSWVYAASACNIGDLEELAERELIVLREQEVWRDPLVGSLSASGSAEAPVPVTLTEQQSAAWERIEPALAAAASGGSGSQFLLRGVTGSGKTELYLRAARAVVRRSKQVIVLVPEIALTPQTIDRFVQHFPGQVGLIHSQLSEGERYDTWRRARAGSLQVIIGPRSALFAPLPQVGLLVVDECHDSSYVQS